MVKRFLLLLLTLVTFFMLTSVSSANTIDPQDSKIKNCFDTAPGNYLESYNAETYNQNLFDCLKRDLVPDHPTWQCESSIDCPIKFAESVCAEVNNRIWYRRNVFVQKCETLKDQYQTLFIEKNKLAPTVAPTPTPTINQSITPTPTAITNSVSASDECIALITQDCRTTMIALDRCYNNLNAGSGVWSCLDENNQDVADARCKASFTNRIRQNVYSKFNEYCDGNYTTSDTPIGSGGVNVSRIINYSTLSEIFDKKLNIRRNNALDPFDLGPTPYPPTPAIIDNRYLENLVIQDDLATDSELLEDAKETLTCGFAGVEGKNVCCSNTIKDITPSLSGQDAIAPQIDCGFWQGVFGVCDLPDFSQLAKDKFTEYFEQNNIVGSLNEYIDKQGELPQCFIGVPSTSTAAVSAINVAPVCTCEFESAAAICQRYIDTDDTDALAKCNTCMQNNDIDEKNFYTALGCIDTSIDGIITMVFTLGLGISGTTALFCIIYAAFIMQTSQNNPERIQKAQETITSCITGLILIIFSIFILRVIGVDLLRIPGFG